MAEVVDSAQAMCLYIHCLRWIVVSKTFGTTYGRTKLSILISGNRDQKRTFDTLHQQSKVKLTRRILTLTPTSL